ncbi:MAG: type I 3-dehydroquinate dehydratase [Candidatus Micrarchaeaceae archaeon]
MAHRSAKHLIEKMRSEPIIIATIRAETGEEFLGKASMAKTLGADAVELRIDMLRPSERICIPDMVQMSERPVVATCRKEADGGRYNEGEEERVALQKEAMEYGAQFVDIEANASASVRGELVKAAIRNDAKIIMSKHDNGMPQLRQMRSIFKDVHALPHDMIKMVFTPQSQLDALRLLDAAQSMRMHRKPYTVFGMGEYGRPTRIFSLLMGGSFMYCSLESNGRNGNLYQVSVSDMRETFKLIGNPVSWRRIRKEPEWVRSLAEEWSVVSNDTYNNVAVLKRKIREELDTLFTQ